MNGDLVLFCHSSLGAVRTCSNLDKWQMPKIILGDRKCHMVQKCHRKFFGTHQYDLCVCVGGGGTHLVFLGPDFPPKSRDNNSFPTSQDFLCSKKKLGFKLVYTYYAIITFFCEDKPEVDFLLLLF